MTRMLASVASAAEARTAVTAGADLIDLKDPTCGALGALPRARIAEAVRAVSGARPVSATVGDLPMAPARVVAAVAATARLGVDYVKLGLVESHSTAACIDALAPLCRAGIRVVLVLFADLGYRREWLDGAARSGCAGVMLDTATKTGGGLRVHASLAALAAFLDAASERGLLTGLAGSLRAEDVEPLLALHPDYLGFRGALCAGSRAGALVPEAVESLRALISRHDVPALASRRGGSFEAADIRAC